jgi:hypothetical protein
MGQDQAFGALASQQVKWQARQPASYRLCVASFNALLIVLTETDVVQGKVRVARQVANERALKARIEADDWSPSQGKTVEMLFDDLRQRFIEAIAPKQPEYRFVTTVVYDQTFGFPAETNTNPAPGTDLADAGVATLVALTPSPAEPLPPPSSRPMRP